MSCGNSCAYTMSCMLGTEARPMERDEAVRLGPGGRIWSAAGRACVSEAIGDASAAMLGCFLDGYGERV